MPFIKGNTLGRLHKNPNFNGNKNPFFGKKHSTESLKKMSESHKGLLAGEKHPNWKGDKHCRFWNKKVKERDNYTCQSCGLRDSRIMQADHIKSKKIYPELATSLENGITLCPNCHAIKTYVEDKEEMKTHKQYKIKEWRQKHVK